MTNLSQARPKSKAKRIVLLDKTIEEDDFGGVQVSGASMIEDVSGFSLDHAVLFFG